MGPGYVKHTPALWPALLALALLLACRPAPAAPATPAPGTAEDTSPTAMADSSSCAYRAPEVPMAATPAPLPTSASGEPAPTPAPTPTVAVAPVTLPAALPGVALESRLGPVARWRSAHGRTGPMAIGERDGQRYAFVASDGRLRLLRLPPEGPSQKTGVEVPIGHEDGYVQALEWEGDVLAVAVGDALLAYNVSVPQQPQLVERLQGIANFLDLDDRRAFVECRVSETKSEVRMVDVGRPGSMVALGSLGYSRDEYNRQVELVHGLTARGYLAYVHRSLRKGREYRYVLEVLDISSPEEPRKLGEMPDPGGPLYLAESRAYVLTEDLGVRVLDLSDPARPREVGYLLDDSPGTASSIDPSEPAGLIVDGQRLYALMWGGDWGVYHWRLRIVDIADPTRPRELGRLEGDGIAWGMWLQAQELVLVDQSGTSILDVSDPARPREAQRVPAASAAVDVRLQGQYALLFLRSGVFALDLADPTGPRASAVPYFGPVGRVRQQGNRYLVQVYGEYAIYEIDASALPRVVAEKSRLRSLPARTGVSYSASCGRLELEDESQPGAVLSRVLLARSDCSDAWDVAALGSHVYVVGDGRLFVLDASRPEAPSLIAEKGLASRRTDARQARILVEGSRAYVLQGGLWVLGLSDPQRPREMAYYPTDALALDVQDGRIALGGPDGGFTLLEERPAAP